jgi:hypothetical protein
MARNYAAVPHEYLEEMAPLSDSEFGRLIRALLRYSITGEVVELTGNERFYAQRIVHHEDRIQANYEELRQKRSEAGRKGAQSRWGEGLDGKNGKNGKAKAKPKAEAKPKDNTSPSTDGRSRRADARMCRDMDQMDRLLSREEGP